MAPAASEATSSSATSATSSTDDDAPASPSPSPSRRAAPTLLLVAFLAALLILSSGDDATAQPLNGVSLENPEVSFVPSPLAGQFCERVLLSGVPRLHFDSYASQIRVKMNVSQSIPEKFHWKIEVCLHRNASMDLCQCEAGEWQGFQDGIWTAVNSPYGNKYVDVKLADKKPARFTLSIQEEFQKWRLACLGIGFVLLFLSPIVSKWAPFYYSSSMALGVLLVVLIVLFQPRILMAMARDGLLPSFFSDVNKQTQVPVKSTIVTGICAAALAFAMDVSQLAGMVSVGTLLAFTIVAVSILILRYVPPDEVPLPPSMQESFRLNQKCDEETDRGLLGVGNCNLSQTKDVIVVVESVKDPLIDKRLHKGKMDETKRRKIASLSIGSVCVGVLILTSSASATWLPFLPICIGCIIGVVLLLTGLSLLSWIDQDAGRHSFGHSGGFTCPFVPVLPVLCILINTYLLINLGGDTWMRVGIWLLMGVLVYIFYGRTHSSLADVVYVPVAQADEIYRSSSGYVS